MKRLLVVIALIALPTTAFGQVETIEYYQADAVGSIRIVYDVNGNVIGRQDYTPFGTPVLNASSIPEGFGGNEKDDESNELYFHARSLTARIGRFGSPDAIFAGLFEPQAWNRYAYAINSPLTYVDPDGTQHKIAPVETNGCDQENLKGTLDYFIGCLGYNPLPNNGPRPGTGNGPGGNGDNGGGRGGGNGNGGNGNGNSGNGNNNNGSNGTGDGGDDGNKHQNDCQQFTQTLTTATLQTGLSALKPYGAYGLNLVDVAIQNPWFRGRSRKLEGTAGVRPGLISKNQGNDVYHHIVFEVGAMFALPPEALGLFVAVDATQAISGRAESQTELMDDMVGIAVGVELAVGTVTGNAQRTQHMVTSTVCSGQ